MDEQEYIKYLQEQQKNCLAATGNNNAWAIAMFDKVASPRYYWEQAQNTREQPQQDTMPMITEKQKKAIQNFIHFKPELEDELTGQIDNLTKTEASEILEKWIPKKKA